MKNIFELLANNLFVRREPKLNLRCDLDFRNARADIQEAVGCKLKKNQSYFSLLIDRCEVFLGEVNYDISSIPIGKFYEFSGRFTRLLTEQLKEFVNTTDKELVKKLQEHMKNGDYTLRYIVKDDTKGDCLSFKCNLEWGFNDPLFALRSNACDFSFYSPTWLDYWYNRKRYFAEG